MQVVRGGVKGNQGSKTWATKKALYNYAAWVDVEFHDAVFEAIERLTEGNTQAAQTKAYEVAAAKIREELRDSHDYFTDLKQHASNSCTK